MKTNSMLQVMGATFALATLVMGTWAAIYNETGDGAKIFATVIFAIAAAVFGGMAKDWDVHESLLKLTAQVSDLERTGRLTASDAVSAAANAAEAKMLAEKALSSTGIKGLGQQMGR